MMMKISFSDEMAMNWIADLLKEEHDQSEIVKRIHEIVRLTGRNLLTNTENEE